jgi:serine/threonine-protein kinase
MPEAPSPSVQLPAPFGKYLLQSLLAVGGMAEVYRAKIFGASGFEKEMVVKRILPKYAQNPAFIQMLVDEAKIAVSLSHGNIVPIYELGELDGSYYIAMEFVEGRTILDILRDAHGKRAPISWPQCLGIAAEVCRGLAYAHDRLDPSTGKPLGLVHRDINPRNIVITPGGEVKILDFGIARASTKRHQTASGVIKGTPGYMSPEQMYGQTIDHRSDIYCVGIMVFELLTLRRLFPVWDVAEMRQVFEAGPVPPPSSLNPALPRELDTVVGMALAPNARDRWQTAADLEEALRTAIARSGVAVTASGLARELQAIGVVDAGPRRSVGVTPTAVPQSQRRDVQPGDVLQPPLATTGPSSVADAPRAATPGTHTIPVAGPGIAPGASDDDDFVISVVDNAKPPVPLAPLPQTSAKAIAAHPRTQVLAQNAALGWSQNIGDDAELLALARAVGSAPGAGRRTLLAAAAVAVVVTAGAFALFGADIRATVARAVSGQQQELGVIVVKVRPPPDDVVLDDKSRGPGNKKIANVDIGVPHRLIVRPKGQEPIVHELTRADFAEVVDGSPTFSFEKDLTPQAAGAPALPSTTR